MIKQLFLWLSVSLCTATIGWGQGWYHVYPDSNVAGTIGTRTIATFDQGQIYVQQVSGTPNRLVVTKLDRLGTLEWTQELARATGGIRPIGIAQLPSDSTYIIVQGRQIYRLNLDGTSQPTYTHPQFFPGDVMILHPSGYMVLIGQMLQTGSYQTVMQRIWPNGSSAGLYTYPSLHYFASKVTLARDKGVYLIGRSPPSDPAVVELSKTTPMGGLDWRRLLLVPNYNGIGLIPTTVIGTIDTGCLVSAYDSTTTSIAKPILIKYDQQGQELWRSFLPSQYDQNAIIEQLWEASDGTYAVLISTHSWQEGQLDVVHYRTNGSIQRIKTLLRHPYFPWFQTFDFKQIGNNYRVLGKYQTNTGNGTYHFMFETDTLLTDLFHQLSGKVYDDLNNNCQADTMDGLLPQLTIKITHNNSVQYATTNTQGDYSILLVDSGQYMVEIDTSLPYRLLCPYIDTIFLQASNRKDTVDIGYQPQVTCPYLQVDLSAPFLRRCFNSNYTVRYQNIGTSAANNAYVDVTLDPYLRYQSSSIPLATQNGLIHRFNIGTIPAMSSGTFTIQVAVDCDSTALGQTHCSEAHIYPDVYCGDPWLGPNIEVSSSCSNDTIEFRLRNTGAAMSVPRPYVVIEEHVMILQNNYQLGSGDSLIIRVPAVYNYRYRLEVVQSLGFPSTSGDPTLVFNHQFCGAVPPRLQTPTHLGDYYNGNISPFIAVDCQPNIGAFDPNDKQTQPVGYGPQHLITKNTPLNYHIRFQNTGTDTAFTVVIVDTLDTDLDPMTLQLGAASHPYTWSLSGTGILTVRFDNIMLPDSNVNEPLSHGFVKFQINQQPDHPNGTRLTNRAAIYFDFNSPIVTNAVFHTVGSNFIPIQLLGIDEPLLEAVQVRFFPNPMTQQAILAVEGIAFDDLQLEVYNVMGHRLQTHVANSGTLITVERGQLAAGAYFYRLVGDGQLIATGKMIVQ